MGPFLSFKRKYKRREEAYTPELIEENKAKIITKFTMSAAKGIFIFSKTITNGLTVVPDKVFQGKIIKSKNNGMI